MTKCCGKPMRVVASTVLVKIEYCFACKRKLVTRRRGAKSTSFTVPRRQP